MRRAATGVISAARRRQPRWALLGAAAFGLSRLRAQQPFGTACAAQPSRPPPTRVPSGNVDAPKNAVLVKNGKASEPWLTKGRLLKEFSGAYTTARTVDGDFVFELSMHCTRLHQTFTAVLRRALGIDESADAAATASGDSLAFKKQALRFFESAGPAGIKPLIEREILVALEHLRSTGDCRNEHQVTMLITCDSADSQTPGDRGFDVFTFVQPLPPVKPMVDVEARRAERKNPTIKDVQWVSDRQHLEEMQRQSGVEEVVMFDAGGHVTEGLQTNFFAVSQDGTVFTAPDERVLAGTVRKVVVEVCQQNGISVRFECPSIDDVTTWESCFICSTSRLVKPIQDIDVPEHSAHRQFPASGSVAHRIEALVRDAVRSNSEPLRAA